MLVVGGMTSVTGAVVGCYFVTIIYDVLPPLGGRRLRRHCHDRPSGTANLVLAAALLVVLILRPNGLTGGKEMPWPTDLVGSIRAPSGIRAALVSWRATRSRSRAQ